MNGATKRSSNRVKDFKQFGKTGYSKPFFTASVGKRFDLYCLRQVVHIRLV